MVGTYSAEVLQPLLFREQIADLAGLHCVRLCATGGKVLVGELRPPFLVHPVQLLAWQPGRGKAPEWELVAWSQVLRVS